MKTCEKCGATYDRHPRMAHKQWEASRFCSRSCSNSWLILFRQENHRDYVVGELAWLLGTDTPDSIARRLGYKDAESLIRMCERWTRNDLAKALRRGMNQDVAA